MSVLGWMRWRKGRSGERFVQREPGRVFRKVYDWTIGGRAKSDGRIHLMCRRALAPRVIASPGGRAGVIIPGLAYLQFRDTPCFGERKTGLRWKKWMEKYRELGNPNGL